jgi:hypothetical protein
MAKKKIKLIPPAPEQLAEELQRGVGIVNGKKYQYPMMTPKEYERARAYFELPPDRFARLIGVQWRQEARYRAGTTPIPETTARLIRTALRLGLAAEDIG